MSTSPDILKTSLQPAKGKERLQLLLKLCELPSFWGELDELSCLQEADQLAQQTESNDEKAKINYLFGKYFWRKANYDLATDYLQKALRQSTDNKNTRGKLDCQVQLGFIDIARSFFENALVAANNGINLSMHANYGKAKAGFVLVKAIAQLNLGDLNDSLIECNAALEIYEAHQDVYGMATSFHNIGAVYDSMGKYTEALETLNFSLKMREDIGDRFGTTDTLNEIGIVHWKQSNHLEGVRQIFRALKTGEETGDKYNMAVSYNTIGNINSNLGNYKEALTYYGLALQLCQDLKRKKGIASAYYNIGIVYYELGEYDSALQNHLTALQISTEIGNKEGICASHNYIGKVYAARNNFEEALRYQMLAINFGIELGDKRRFGIALTGAGATLFQLNRNNEAIEHLTTALAVGRELGEKTIEKDALFTLIEVAEKNLEFKQALEYFRQYHQVQSEISSESVQKQLTTLNFQHSLEVKEKESALLKEKNEEIERYLHKLEISNNELKQFAHVAAHDLREPLRMISSYIGLLSQSMGENLNEAQKKFIGFAIDGSKRMELLIEDMLRLAKVDADPKIEKIELDSIIAEIKLNLDTLMKEKGSSILFDKLPAIMADRTQILQLFQNIIGNGIKYNESEQPLIKITHQITGEELQITIADNGIGIPPHYREKAFHIFQRVPTSKKYSGSGIGLAICKKIVDNMNGKIWIEENPGGGTRFGILFTTALTN